MSIHDGSLNEKEEPLNKTSLHYFVKLLFSTGFPKLFLGIAVLLSIISSLAGLVVPLVTGKMIDQFRLELLNTAMILQLVFIFILQAVSSGFSY